MFLVNFLYSNWQEVKNTLSSWNKKRLTRLYYLKRKISGVLEKLFPLTGWQIIFLFFIVQFTWFVYIAPEIIPLGGVDKFSIWSRSYGIWGEAIAISIVIPIQVLPCVILLIWGSWVSFKKLLLNWMYINSFLLFITGYFMKVGIILFAVASAIDIIFKITKGHKDLD